jgi:hypothetical protein
LGFFVGNVKWWEYKGMRLWDWKGGLRRFSKEVLRMVEGGFEEEVLEEVVSNFGSVLIKVV